MIVRKRLSQVHTRMKSIPCPKDANATRGEMQLVSELWTLMSISRASDHQRVWPVSISAKMAYLLKQSTRAADLSICRQCLKTQPKRTYMSFLSQQPKSEIRSRSPNAIRSTQLTVERSTNGRSFTSSSRRAYKTVEEAKSRYKLGV
jgi:hypothetical protein